MLYPTPSTTFHIHIDYLGYRHIHVYFDGWIYDDDQDDYLPVGVHPTGYHYVNIYQDGHRYRQDIHRLVAAAFLHNDDPLHKTQVNHKNGDKTDNCATNLEWCTQLENIQHARTHGLYPQMYLTEEIIRSICVDLCSGMKSAAIARKNNVTPSAVGCIKTGKTWKHISRQYPGLPMMPDSRYVRK